MFAFIIGLNNIMLNNHSIAILLMLMTKIEVCLLFAMSLLLLLHFFINLVY